MTKTVQTAARKRRTLRDTRQAMVLMSKFRRDEDGGLILFSLFIFILMLLIAGVAVDVMRFETRRTALQNTLDSASLAATNLRQERDPDTLVRDFMEKRGYNPDLVNVTITQNVSGASADEPGTIMAREVRADYRLDVNTFFMPLIGIDSLGTVSAGAAYERIQNVEVSLVVDISGSMQGTKLEDLKRSANDFFEQVINEDAEEGIVAVSLIPYNHTVVVPDDLFDRLTTQARVNIPLASIDTMFLDSNGVPFTGTLREYNWNHPFSRCVRWSDDDMMSNDMASDYADIRAVSPDDVLDLMASYDPDAKSAGSGGSYDPPANEWNRRCDPTRSAILPYQTQVQPLKDAVDAMYASGNTAVDHGMKWGVALLDPTFRPLVADMIDNGILPTKMQDRPYDYDSDDTLKVVVLMTDGRNTGQYDLKDEFKRGPSRIWYSERAGNEEITDPDDPSDTLDVSDEYIVDRNKNGVRDRRKYWYDGFYVLMPDNGNNARWMRPHKPWDRDDATGYREDELPDDARQLSYDELYEMFSERALADLFRDDYIGDWSARSAHYYAETVAVDGSEGDDRLNGDGSAEGICAAAKMNDEIRVFTIAFGSGADLGEMQQCASSLDDAYYADNGDDLSEAFSAIASAITQLRLTQ